ncbi:hypothetical protein POL68_28165 [Stigmatella sp. ncwal1]|uniref:Uncharacterized protein n=1 Tax=Stigmatella ashevillensis TaxID=2995309 RepID=A0ABT5DFT9_9BACT|nr:hypothetical protein [Stigmatella ashevillena]MDC0712371.1 hypothetical protein [Stigmatella ashevillena]
MKKIDSTTLIIRGIALAGILLFGIASTRALPTLYRASNAAAPQDSHLVPISLLEQTTLLILCLGSVAFFIWLLRRPLHPSPQALTTGTASR